MKAMLDHFGYRWMPHRPAKEMFGKRAVIITQCLGAGGKWAGISTAPAASSAGDMRWQKTIINENPLKICAVWDRMEKYKDMMRDEKMCEALRELMQDEIEKERADERKVAKVDAIKKMMKNLKFSAEQAMQALEIPKKEWAKYSAML